MNVFVINLPRDLNKKEHMDALLLNQSIIPTYIEAVDGKKNVKHDILVEGGRGLTPGEIGCALSHKKIYQHILEENICYACILEDDVEFDSSIKNFLDRDYNDFAKWDIILLGHHADRSREAPTKASIWNQKKISEQYFLGKPIERAYGTYGYIISLAGAKKLLDELSFINKPIDHLTGDITSLNIFVSIPPVVKIFSPFEEFSNISDDRLVSYSNFKKSKSLGMHKIVLRRVFVESGFLNYVSRLYIFIKLKFLQLFSF